MKNTRTNVGSFAAAKLQAKRRSLLAIALVAVIGFAMAGCGEDPSGDSPAAYSIVTISNIAYGNGKWVAATDGYNFEKMASSADGINWTAVTWPFLSTDGARVTIRELIGGNSGFVAVLDHFANGHWWHSIWRSANGETWTRVTGTGINPEATPYVVYCNGSYLLSGTFGGSANLEKIKSSADGETWTDEVWNVTYTLLDGEEYSYPIDSVWEIAYGNGKYISIGGNCIIYSADRRNWTEAASLDIIGLSPEYITFGNGKWVAVGNGLDYTESGMKKTAYSTDGENWTAIAYSSDSFLRKPIAGDNAFIMIATTGWEVGLACSADGETWTKNPAIKYIDSAAWGNGQFIMYGDDGSLVDGDGNPVNGLFRSTNGVSWTKIPAPEAFKY